ncbi:MAG: hypothetical protein KAJ96_06455, partial [Candidatus Thorarchaeota archaeon]|nr:hypothetical protein [Candidatus Thorarchaeota archaeon]
TDSDGLSDGAEYNVYLTDPTLWDSDGDTLSDYDEIFVYGSNPLSTDSDGDGLLDAADFMPTVHWIVPAAGIVGLLIALAIVTKRVREDYFMEEFVTTAEPASPGLEPGMAIAVEYKIREGKVVFGVVIRNGSENAMQNVQVILGVPDLTDSIRSEAIGTVEAGAMNVVEIEFELQPGAEGELVGMVEYDSVEGEHRVVNLRPVKIVA